MSTAEATRSTSAGSARLGLIAAVLAAATAVSAVMIGVISFTSFNPPDWVRLAATGPFPLLLLGSLAFAGAGIAMNRGRSLAYLALGIDGLAIAAFIIMLNIGY